MAMNTSEKNTIADKKLITRSISLPVQQCLSSDWREFLRTLHAAWRMSTDLANWASQTIARHDVVRTPDMQQLPKFEPIDLYALAFGRRKEKRGKDGVKVLPVVDGGVGGWEGARIAAASLLRRVLSKYLKERGKIIWRRERRTPEYLYPVPFPVHTQAWAVFFDKGRPIISMALPGGRVSVRLRNGDEFAPAIRVLKGIEDGTIKAGELSICRQRSYCPDRKDGERLPGGGHRESYRVMVRISYQVQVAEPLEGNTIVQVATGTNPFITVDVPGCLPWVLHVPQMAQHIIAHKQFRDRFADDMKYEKRWPRGKRRRMLRRLERGCDKQNRRLDSFCKETAAQIVGYVKRAVKRNRLPPGIRIEWNDTNRSFAASFPWHQLRAAMSCKCEVEQIRLEIVEASEVAAETPA